MNNIYPLTPTIGTIPPNKIVGRYEEIEKLKKLLRAQSVTIEEFRRMGKTLLVQKLEYLSQQTNDSNVVIYFMLQGVKDVTELTDVLLDSLRRKETMGRLKVAWSYVKTLYNNFKPDEITIEEITFKLPEFKTRWKDALSACINDLAERSHQNDELLTLVLDEFPVMLWDWMENGKTQDAIELLDLFRNLRISLKEKGHIRFIFCGSVGMQVVLDRLRREHRYTGEPLNDMISFRLDPMGETDAMLLCQCLAQSGFTLNDDSTALFERICQFSEKLPYYINRIFHIVDVDHKGILTSATLSEAEESLLNDPDKDDTFKQLYQRIGIYYEDTKAERMLVILNFLSKHPNDVSEDVIHQHLALNNRKELLDALETLRKEQYLIRKIENETRYYQFKHNLIKRWWKLNKA